MNVKKIVRLSIIIILLVIVLFTIFRFFNYKNLKSVNNIGDKTLKEIEEYILNISSYESNMEVVVESNKNTNKYIMNQKFVAPNVVSQEIVEPKNIEGLTVKYDGNNLEIFNSNLNLNTIYENYEYVADNVLWLSDFIQNYKKENGEIREEEEFVIMEFKCNKNKYCINEKLYIDRKANKISKLIIQDENKKNRIYITYNRIEISSLN